MSGDNPDKTEIGSTKSENETDYNTDKNTSDEANVKTDVVLPADKILTPSEEVVIDIINFNSGSDGKAGKNVDYLVEYHASQIKPPQATMVYQAGFEQHAMYGDPLDYSPDSRNSFIRLVFSIVLGMILITAAFVAMVLFSESFTDFFIDYGYVLAIPAMLMMVALNYAIICSPCTRMYPFNIVLLVLAVIGMSIICAYITVRYDTSIVFYAVVATSAVVFVCIMLAYTSFDFTSWMIYIVVIAAAFSAVFMIAMIVMMLTSTYMRMLHLALLTISTLISVCILTMELQMILGGRAIEIGEEDYALAAFLLYTSIVDIFLKMVQMLGICDNM